MADSNWNTAIKDVLITGLSGIPEVGGILSSLLGCLWPNSGEDIWGEIKDEVQQAINQALDTDTYNKANGNLQGLKSVINDYQTALGENSNAQICNWWDQADGDFDLYCPNFQTPGYEVLLLPLFVQFANMHLSLLQDGVNHGMSWGWTNEQYNDCLAKLQNLIQTYTTWANNTSTMGQNNVSQAIDYHNCLPFKANNTYVRHDYLMVKDFVLFWPNFDSTANLPVPAITREIFSDPIGTCDESGNIVPDTSHSAPLTSLVVYIGNEITAIQYTNSLISTGLLGLQNQPSNPHTHPIRNIDPTNPITGIMGASGDIINSIQFVYQDGTSTHPLGGGGGSPYNFSFPEHELTSIHVNGVSSFYQSIDCMVFGFKYPQN